MGFAICPNNSHTLYIPKYLNLNASHRHSFALKPALRCFTSSRSAEMNGYTAALRDQYINTSMSTHYHLLPHLFSYAAQSGLLTPQPRSLYPQSHPLVLQLVAAEDLAPLTTPMLIEDGSV